MFNLIIVHGHMRLLSNDMIDLFNCFFPASCNSNSSQEKALRIESPDSACEAPMGNLNTQVELFGSLLAVTLCHNIRLNCFIIASFVTKSN